MFQDLPKDNEMIVTITSFNEWHEGTQIEAQQLRREVSDTITYENYHQGPFSYISLTRESYLSYSPVILFSFCKTIQSFH